MTAVATVVELTVEQVIAWLAAHPEVIADVEAFIHGTSTRSEQVDAARAAGDAAVDAYEIAKGVK